MTGTDPATFFIGANHAGKHVVPAGDALAAIACTERAPTAFASCGAQVVIATGWGPYHRAHPRIASAEHRLCQCCAWTAALATGQVEAELAALHTDDVTAAVMARDWIDPRLVSNLCRAILAENTNPDTDEPGVSDEPNPRLVQLLAHASAHRPVLLLPEACADGDCNHPADTDGPGRAARCAADGLLACPACSLQTGDWAGEWEGQFQPECTIAAPCEVLRTMAANFAVLA